LRFPLSEKPNKLEWPISSTQKINLHQRNRHPILLLYFRQRLLVLSGDCKICQPDSFKKINKSSQPFQVLYRNQHVKKIFFCFLNALK